MHRCGEEGKLDMNKPPQGLYHNEGGWLVNEIMAVM